MTENDSALDCLRNLPPFDPTTTVHLYLCRHAQTEYNRLNIVQGARVNVPINETGEKQAILPGQAIARAAVPPEMISIHHCSALNKRRFWLPDSIGEEAEGAPVSEKRAELLALYSAWALGNLDARMASGGESGREVRIKVLLDNTLVV